MKVEDGVSVLVTSLNEADMSEETLMNEYTEQDVVNAVANAVKRFPGRINPTDSREVCLYTSEQDPDHHCIAGQVLVDFGLELPPIESGDNQSSISDYLVDGGLSHYFTEDAKTALSVAQSIFDRSTTVGSRRDWSDTLKVFLNEYENRWPV